jgi:hypothetical protein
MGKDCLKHVEFLDLKNLNIVTSSWTLIHTTNLISLSFPVAPPSSFPAWSQPCSIVHKDKQLVHMFTNSRIFVKMCRDNRECAVIDYMILVLLYKAMFLFIKCCYNSSWYQCFYLNYMHGGYLHTQFYTLSTHTHACAHARTHTHTKLRFWSCELLSHSSVDSTPVTGLIGLEGG